MWSLVFTLETIRYHHAEQSPESYGLSLTLGSAGVTLLELTNAYAMLARLGVYKPFILEEGRMPRRG